MRLFFSERQMLHRDVQEMAYGRLTPANDRPERTIAIREALLEAGLAIPQAAEQPPVPPQILTGVHDPSMLGFLESLHRRWQEQYPGTLPFPETSVAPGMQRGLPRALRGQLASFCFDTCAAVVEGTWEAVSASLSQAHAATLAICGGDKLSFALCRPPGHHAGRNFYGGYCYGNAAAVAAETWVQRRGTSAAILDLDFHHGNGTQHIFWQREDVLFVSIHADPSDAYPFFSGYAEEKGSGAGLGHTLNLPLALDSGWPQYRNALHRAIEQIERFDADVLIVSFGTDTYHEDPVGGLGLQTADFAAMGATLRSLGLPTVVVMEGGYHLPTVGTCVANFMDGLANGTP